MVFIVSTSFSVFWTISCPFVILLYHRFGLLSSVFSAFPKIFSWRTLCAWLLPFPVLHLNYTILFRGCQEGLKKFFFGERTAEVSPPTENQGQHLLGLGFYPSWHFHCTTSFVVCQGVFQISLKVFVSLPSIHKRESLLGPLISRPLTIFIIPNSLKKSIPFLKVSRG